MLTLSDYFTRRSTGENLSIIYASELTDAIRDAASALLARVNALLTQFYLDTPDAPRRVVNSGWRPSVVNAAVGGAPHSAHLTGEAIDLADADRLLGRWCMNHQDQVIAAGLCGERPEATATWVHLQTKRVGDLAFYWPTQSSYDKWAKAGSVVMA